MKTNGMIQLYPLVRVAVILVAGMTVGYMTRSYLLSVHWLSAAALVMILTAVIRKVYVQSFLVFAVVFFIGGAAMSHAWYAMKTMTSHSPVLYEAVVFSSPIVRERVVTCDLLILLQEEPVLIKSSFVRDARSEHLRMGDGLEACSSWKSWKENPSSSFDYALYMKSHGYRA
jgi:competence protein ComEC